MSNSEEYPIADRYEPPSVKLLMEILKLLAATDQVTITLTIAAGK